MEQRKFSIGEAMSFGWNAMKQNYWFLLGVGLIYIVASGISNAFLPGDVFKTQPLMIARYIVGFALVILLVIMQLGFVKIGLLLADGKDVSFGVLVSQWRNALKFFIARFLLSLIVIAGLILLIVPGIILGLRLQFVGYAIADKGMGPFAAMAHSWRVTRGQTWDLLLLGLVSVGTNILGFLVIIVGLTVSIPVTMVARAHVYRRLVA